MPSSEPFFGVGRDVLQALVESWPAIDEHSSTTYVAINNTLLNLLGYPHGSADPFQSIGVPQATVARVFRRWSDARDDHS
jgi:hypothetical protein